MKTPTKVSEAGRIRETRRFLNVDADCDEGLKQVVTLAAAVCQTEMAAITLIDSGQVHFQASVGTCHAPIPRANSLFDLTIQHDRLLVIEDALKDAKLRSAPMVREYPHIRAYAGMPLLSDDGFRIGTISVMDPSARDLEAAAKSHLPSLAKLTVESLQRRRAVNELDQAFADHTAIHVALSESEQFATSTVDALSNIIAVLDKSGTIIAVNKAWRDFSSCNGAQPEAIGIGVNYLDVCRRASQAGSREATAAAEGIEAIIAGKSEAFTIEYPCHAPEQKRWFFAQGSRFLGTGSARVVIAHQNITARKIAELKLKDQAEKDALTRLANRSRFQEVLEQCFRAHKDAAGHRFYVLFLDLDRFKLVNDSLGHSLGDELLASVAKDLHVTIRPWQGKHQQAGHCIARLGGDEFGVILNGIDETDHVVTLAERLLEKIGVHRMIGGYEVFTSASVGVAWAQPGDQSAEDVLRRADIAMYEAKGAGKNRVGVFDESMHERISKTRCMEVDLRHALERDEFFLVYQPIMCLRTGRLRGFEALIRWQRPGFGMVPPYEFITLAEETGLIEPIGRWVTMAACKQLAKWHAIQDGGEQLTMNVNLSRRQLTDRDLLESIQNVIDTTKIPPHTLRLEVTESSIIELTDTIEKLESIKQLGVLLYIDDFGTGHSSLTCLHKFPVDGLKIDRSFIRDATGRRDMAALIQAVVTLGSNLGLGVVAEGLETADQVAMLQSMDCAFGQGYYFARPMLAKDALGFIRQSTRVSKLVAPPQPDRRIA